MSSKRAIRHDNILRPLATCGIVAPLFFTSAVLTLGLLRPGYDHVKQAVSELGVGPNSILFNASLVISGLLTIAFAYGMHQGVESLRSKTGPVSLAVGGIGLAGAGAFPFWPFPFPGLLHIAFALIFFGGMIIAPLAISRTLEKNKMWRRYRFFSLVLGLWTLAVFVVFVSGIGQIEIALQDAGVQVTVSGFLAPWGGAIERLLIGSGLLWEELMAVKLVVSSLEDSSLERGTLIL